MATSRLLSALLAAALGALFVVPAAMGKEGVRATLDTPLPVEAAGKPVTIAWTLSYSDRGRRHPFGAGGVFVRLASASGGAPVKRVGKQVARGRFVAEATVPEGGIGGISIGLEGIRQIGGRTEDADVFFPLDNDPFAEAADGTGDGDSLPIWLAVAGTLAALGAMLTVPRALRSRRRFPKSGRTTSGPRPGGP